MDERDWLAQRFQAHRPRLRAVAYRMLGSASEADDAVVFERLAVTRTTGVAAIGGWSHTAILPGQPQILSPEGANFFLLSF
jgi:DNA-directed RNA polymerase specialized sigma24 family protein